MSRRRRDGKRVLFTNCHSDTSSSESSLEYEDVLERKIEELSRHLAEEKQVSKREKIHVARLHRELARYKGDKEVKEKDSILKDLEKERMLRTEAEKRLRELSAETSQSQTRFSQLQTDFQKMEQAVSQMMQFKSKIDQLKQEKTSLSVQYENNIQKYNSHISTLERENIMLLNDVKKFEQQMSSGTDQERTQLLLERLKVLEAENSSLVLENEQQRQQYEKCLDEIANQVVQALLAQKTLREECLQLQTRVQDLEHQNKELNHMFQQKVKYSSDTVLQSLPPSQTVSTSTLCESSGYYNSVCSLPSASVSIEAMHVSTTVAHCNNHLTQPDQAHNNSLHPVAIGNLPPASHTSCQQPVAMGYHLSASTDSSQLSTSVGGQLSTSNDSIHSDNAFEDNKTSRCNSVNCGTKCDNIQCKTKIETEFPATNSSPKMKHVSISERNNERTKQRSNSTSSLNTASKLRTFRSNSTNASMSKSRLVQPGVISQSSSSSNVAQGQTDNSSVIQSESASKKRSLSQPEHINKSMLHVSQSKPGVKPVRSELSKSTSKINPKLQKSSSSSNIPMKRTSKSQSSLPQTSQSKLPQKKTDNDSGKRNSGVVSRVPKTTMSKSQGATSTKQTQASPETEYGQREVTPTNTGPARVPSIPNGQYFYDYSDEDSDINRPVSGVSNGSTASVNEILDDDYDTDTLLDANFTTEKFAFFETPQFHKEDKKKEKCKKKKEKSLFSSLRGKPDIVKDTEYSEQKNKTKSPRPHCRRGSLPQSLKSKSNRPSSLVLNSKEKSNMQHAYSSSSLSSTDSDDTYMPHITRQYQLKYKTRNQSGSSETSSMSGSQSEKVQMKSSQESTPTCGEKTFLPPNEQNIYREVIVVKNNENSHSCQTTKKPPPPVPKKPPVAGRRSPGIIMGVQSPGLRIKTQGHDIGVLRPHEFKTGVFESTDSVSSVPIPTVIVPSDANVSQTHKYMSSDSSFESVKNEKVERSGSKDDGYSTMSSDIQPEMMEKFSDSSLKRDTILRSDFQTRNEIIVAHVAEGSHKSVSHGNTVSETTHSQLNVSPKRTVPSVPDRSAGNGSLGRVKAMKQMFEAQCEQANDHPKPFPLRKSYSVDSKLGHKESQSHNVNRRSLGDDVVLNVTIHDEEKHSHGQVRGSNSDQPEQCQEQVVTSENHFSLQSQHTSITHANQQGHFVSNVDHVTLSSDHVTSVRNHDHGASRSHMTADRNSVYHMLNISEENFLSDIPEEKEDYGEMSGASNEKLLDFPMRPHTSKVSHITKLQKFETTVRKYYWSSTSGLCRFLSDSDLDKIMSRDSFENLTELQSGRPLERSVSLSALNTNTEIITNLRLAPTLRRSCHHSLINEISVNDRVKDIVKEHILKQLAHSVDSESDDDLHNYSFAQLLAKKQRQNFLQQSFESKFNQNVPGTERDCPSDPLSSDFHGNKEDFSFQEARGEDRGRQSSKESSPMMEEPSKFRSDYYSLCLVGSNRSLFSGSNEGELEQVHVEEIKCTGCNDPSNCPNCTKAKNSEEFEQISKQLQSLSKTVTALQQTFNGVDSCESDEESNEDNSHMFVSPNSDFHGDGYQWIEDDEFYLTPCGGELIMGASPFSDTGACAEWINEYADDTSCNDEFEFYGNFASERVTDHHFQPPVKEADGFTRHPDGVNVAPPQIQNSSVPRDRNVPAPCGSYSRQRVLRKVEGHGHVIHHGNRKEVTRETGERTDHVLDHQARAAMLDAMVHLSGASMDSLDDNIGVDHVMCSRLIGGAEKAVVKQTVARSAVDLSQFFTRYGEPEKEAVAAFDFLNEVPVDHLQKEPSSLNDQSNTPVQSPQNDSANQCSSSCHGSHNKVIGQSQTQAKESVLEVQKKGPEHDFKPVVKVKQDVQGNSQSVQKSQEIQGNSQNTQKSQEVKGTESTKSKISKPEKKFFNFSRNKLSKSTDSVKEKDSKLPKKVKTKDTKDKDKETPKDKEKSKIPKFARSSSVEQKNSKQLSAKNIQEKSGSLKYVHSSSYESSLKYNSKIVDKL